MDSNTLEILKWISSGFNFASCLSNTLATIYYARKFDGNKTRYLQIAVHFSAALLNASYMVVCLSKLEAIAVYVSQIIHALHYLLAAWYYCVILGVLACLNHITIKPIGPKLKISKSVATNFYSVLPIVLTMILLSLIGAMFVYRPNVYNEQSLVFKVIFR
jgi:hypothetical protein